MQRPWIHLLLLGLLAQAPQLAYGAPPALTLDSLIGQGLQLSPRAQAIRAQVKEAHAARAEASRLPNPSLELELAQAGEEKERSIGLGIRLPLSGKRGAHIEAAGAGIQVAHAEVQQALLAFADELQQGFFLILHLQARQQLLDRQLEQLGRLEAAAQLRQERGQISGFDRLRLQGEGDLLRSLQQSLQVEETLAQAELQALLGSPTPLVLSGQLQQPLLLPDAAVLRLQVQQSGALRALRSRIEQSRLQALAARRQVIPEPTVQASLWEVQAGTAAVTGGILGISVDLPLLDQGKATIAAENALQVRLDAELKQRNLELNARLEGAIQAVTLARQRAERFDAEGLARAEQALRLAGTAYEAGELELPLLLETLRSSLAAREQAVQAHYDARLTELSVRTLVGMLPGDTAAAQP